jgi:hypothetical protein
MIFLKRKSGEPIASDKNDLFCFSREANSSKSDENKTFSEDRVKLLTPFLKTIDFRLSLNWIHY